MHLAQAADDLDGLLTTWQDEWRRSATVDQMLVAAHGLHVGRVIVRLAAIARQGIEPGQNLLDAAFALSALHALLDGKPLDVLLVDAMTSQEAEVRRDAAQAIALVWERNRLVCPDISNPPASCPGRGVFYTSDGISALVAQMQRVMTNALNWPLLRTLGVMRGITAVLENMALNPDELAHTLVTTLLAESDFGTRQHLARALNAYLRQNPRGTDVVLTALRQNARSAGDGLSERLLHLVLPVPAYDAAAALAWIGIFEKLHTDAALPVLAYLVNHPTLSVAWRAGAEAAKLVGTGNVIPAWTELLDSTEALVRWAAALGLGAVAQGLPDAVALQIGDATLTEDAVARLLALAHDADTAVRAAAVRALAGFSVRGTSVPVDILLSAANDTILPEEARALAARAVSALEPAALDRVAEGDKLRSLHQLTAVYRSGTEGYHTFRIPAVVVTTKGTILAFAEGRRLSGSDTGDIDVVLKRSTDGGCTWGPLQVIWDSGRNTSGNPTPVVDQETGRIWLFMSHNLGHQFASGARDGVRTIWVTYSDDDGLTWAEPRNISDQVQSPGTTWDATGPGVGIQLRHGPNAGRLVIPLFWRVIYSDDHGQTWRQGGRHEGANESQVVELSDGRLLRNDRPASWTPGNAVYSRRVLAVSNDQGLTWQANRYPWELVTPYVQGSITRYVPADYPGPEAKILIFANPDHETDRVNLSVWVSTDDGASWPYKKSVYSGPSAYSSLAVLPNGTIGVLFEGGMNRPYENLYWTTFSLDWVLSDYEPPGPLGR